MKQCIDAVGIEFQAMDFASEIEHKKNKKKTIIIIRHPFIIYLVRSVTIYVADLFLSGAD